MVINVSIIGLICASLVVVAFSAAQAGDGRGALWLLIVASVLGSWEWGCIRYPMSFAHAAMVLMSGLFAVFMWLAAFLAGMPSISVATSWRELSGWLGMYAFAVVSTFVFVAHAKWTDFAKSDAVDANSE